MRNITAIVDANGKTEVTTQLIGYSGEHNAVSLEVGFTEEGLSLYSKADYFRIVVDGFYSDKLFLNQNKVIQYNLPQEVMKPPKINCQLLGYKGDESEINLILKSGVFSFQVDCSEVSLQKIDREPDFFEKALHVCTAAAESANNFCELAKDSANSALISEYSAKASMNEVNLKASEVTVNANRAERAAESVDSNNLANALKGDKMGNDVVLKDVSPILHDVNIQLQNEDGSPCIPSTQTITDEVEAGKQTWKDIAPGNIFRYSLPNEVRTLKISGEFRSISIAPIVDGQIELGKDGNIWCMDYFLNPRTLYFFAEFSIVEGILNYRYGVSYDEDVENNIMEGDANTCETIFSENQKITGFAIKRGDASAAYATISIDAQYTEEYPVTVCGKNSFDKSKSIIDGIKNETAVGVKAVKIMEHNAIVQCLKPNVEYTLSYEIECLSVPQNATIREQAVGLTLRVKGGSTIVPIKYKTLKVGDVLNYTSTFTLTEEQYNSGELYLSAYGNAYFNAEGNEEVYPMVIFRNIQIEEGAAATEYGAFVEPQTYFADMDGKLTVPSIYPSMNVYTKNDGIKVNAQYNRDVNKVIKSLVDAVVSLGGKVND